MTPNAVSTSVQRRLSMRRMPRPAVQWWTSERVLAGLRRFAREQGGPALSLGAYHAVAKSAVKGPGRRYPPGYAVLRHWRSFREAWTAAGFVVDRAHEDFTDAEHWFIREAAGILTRNEIAAELKRTPVAVHAYLRDHGLHSYEIHGWTAHRIERVAQVPAHLLGKYMDRGELPYLRGTRCLYFDPADLLVVEEIDWTSPPAELEAAARRSLVERLANILSGRDWAAGRLFTAQPVRTTDKRWRPQLAKPTPHPEHVAVGDAVRMLRTVDSAEEGRMGVVVLIYYRRNTNRTRADSAPQWVARVRFAKLRVVGAKSYVEYTLPVAALGRAEANVEMGEEMS